MMPISEKYLNQSKDFLTKKQRSFLYSYLSKICHKLVEDAEKKGSTGLYINSELLFIAIESALVDLCRLTEYHLPNSLPDRHKYAGFFSFWISKIRPIQLEKSHSKTNDAYFINASLAVAVMLKFLLPKNKEVDHDAIDAIQYTFFYREEKPENLALIAYLLERPVDNEKLEEKRGSNWKGSGEPVLILLQSECERVLKYAKPLFA